MSYVHYTQNRLDLRRKLRAEQTVFENILWQKLRAKQLGYTCRRQFAIGNYIVDFCFWTKKLIIELNGVHHEEDQQEYDEDRTKFLELQGLKVLRFKNEAIQDTLDAVVEKIYQELQNR